MNKKSFKQNFAQKIDFCVGNYILNWILLYKNAALTYRIRIRSHQPNRCSYFRNAKIR